MNLSNTDTHTLVLSQMKRDINFNNNNGGINKIAVAEFKQYFSWSFSNEAREKSSGRKIWSPSAVLETLTVHSFRVAISEKCIKLTATF